MTVNLNNVSSPPKLRERELNTTKDHDFALSTTQNLNALFHKLESRTSISAADHKKLTGVVTNYANEFSKIDPDNLPPAVLTKLKEAIQRGVELFGKLNFNENTHRYSIVK